MGHVPQEKSKEQLFDSLADRETIAPPAFTIDNARPANDKHGQLTLAGKAASSSLEMFGRYQLIKLLGQGNMGSVYLAEDTTLKRLVAVKIPKLSAETDPVLQERFYREARAAAVLNHPNICPVFDVGQINGQQYITMAYVKGRPLSDFVDPDNPAPADQAATLVSRLAHALSQAHSQGVIHRDLKPANVIVDEKREPILMDFGIARQVNSKDLRLTSTGVILGSPGYMSPEQAEGDHNRVGPTSDIYSLGVILYELLTGTIPFQGSLVSVLSQIVGEQDARKPSELRENLNPQLETICRKMMAKQIEDRYQAMTEVYEALSAWLAGDGQPELANRPANLSAFDAKKAIRDVRLEKLVRYKQHIQSLLEQSQYETALKLLQQMAKLKDVRYARYAQWAATEASKTKASIHESKQPYRLQPASKIERKASLAPSVSARRQAVRARRVTRLAKRAVVSILFVIALTALSQLDVPATWRRTPVLQNQPATLQQPVVVTEQQPSPPEQQVIASELQMARQVTSVRHEAPVPTPDQLPSSVATNCVFPAIPASQLPRDDRSGRQISPRKYQARQVDTDCRNKSVIRSRGSAHKTVSRQRIHTPIADKPASPFATLAG